MSTVKNVIAIKSYTKKLIMVLSTEALANTKRFMLELPTTDENGKKFPLENNKGDGFKFYNISDLGFVVVKSYTKESESSEFYCTIKIDNTYGFGALIIDFKDDQSIYLQEVGYRFDDYDGFLKLLKDIIGIDLNMWG